jgi:hypothetical protein
MIGHNSKARLGLGLVVITVSLGLLAGCGDDEKKKDTTVPTFASVQDIITADCATSGCHTASGPYTPLTEAEISATRAATALDRISRSTGQSGVMPQGWTGSTPYDQSADGAKLKAYLQSVK